MSIILRDFDPVSKTAEVVDVFTAEAVANARRLVDFRETPDHPSVPEYERLAAGYLCLAVETHNILQKMTVLERRALPDTLLSQIPPDMRRHFQRLAEAHEVEIDLPTLNAIPYNPTGK